MRSPFVRLLRATTFLPTVYDAEERERLQSFLKGLLIFGIIVDVIGTPLQALLGAGATYVVLFNTGLLIGLLVALGALYVGHPRTASLVLMSTAWAYATLALYWFGGIVNPISAIYIILMLIGGTLLGLPGIVLVTVLSSLSIAVLIAAELTGRLPAPLTETTPTRAGLAILSILATATTLTYIWYASIQRAMGRAKEEIAERRRAEEALRASEERYRLLSSLNADYVFHTRVSEDGSTQLEWVAGAFERISGYSYDEFVTSGGWRAHLYPGDYEQDDEDMRRLGANERVTTEIRIVQKDGSLRWVRNHAHPVWDEARNTLAGIYGAVTDITTEKVAQAREQARRQMLEKVIELGKIITQINDPAECWRAIHTSVQRGLGFDRVGLFVYDAADRTVRGIYGTRESGEIEDTSYFIQSADDYRGWRLALQDPKGLSFVEDYQEMMNPSHEDEMYGVGQHVTLAAWAGEKPVGMIAVDNKLSGRPITREQLEALQLFGGYAGLAVENAQLHSGLESRVRERTAELENVVRELEGFSYTISHDLRAPLRAINGYARILTLEHGAELSAEVVAYLDKIKHNAKNMGQMVDDLLTFSHIGRQGVRRHQLNMNAVVEEALREARKQEQERREIQVNLADLPPSQADSLLVKLALRHLFSNALKYTRGREPALIDVGFYQEDGRIIYFVRDNGIGFDMKYAQRLFGIFTRLHTDPQFEGTGVGLAIAERIFQKHGGAIWAKSEPEAGATFYFTLH
jgi:PAS domain S-box-containing protein